jgi:hypothetical protein
MSAPIKASTLGLSLSCPGVMTGERSCISFVAKAGEGVVADTDLGVGLVCLSKLGHCSYELWAAWPAN